MLGRVLKEVRLPFPDDFFPEIKISPELQNSYHHTAFQLLHATLRDEAPVTRFHPAQQPDSWKLIGERSGLQLYRERGADRGSALQVITIGSLPGSLEDVMWGLYAANHGSFKTQRAIMHRDFLDAAMLQVLEEDPFTEGDPGFTFRFTGLKWLACSSSGKLLHKRDVCWHEELGFVRDANGDEVGFMTMHSVRVSECPPFEQQGVKRSSVSVAYIFRDLGNGRTGVYMKGAHTVGGKSRSWSTDAVMSEMWLAMANVLDCAQSKRLTKLVHGKDVFVASQTGKSCDICDQKLKMLKGGQSCKVCGKNVCDRCRLTKLIYPTHDAAVCLSSHFFCKRCLIDAKDQLYANAPRTSFQSDMSSHRSNSPRYRAASTGPRSVYSSSSSTGSYRGGNGSITANSDRSRTASRDRMRAPSRDQHQHPQQRQTYYSEVRVKQLSPRSSTSTNLSARPTTSSESSFSEQPGSSYSRTEAIGGGSSSYQTYQMNRAHASSSGSMGSFSAGNRGAPPPVIRRNVSGSSAVSQSSVSSQPQRLHSHPSFVSSVGSAYEADHGEVYDDGDDDDSSAPSSSGLSESESESEDERAVVAYQHPSTRQRTLSPTSDVLAKLRQIEAFADDETGLVQLPQSSRRMSSQPLAPAVVLSTTGLHDNQLKYINTYQSSRDGGFSMRGTTPPSNLTSYSRNGGAEYGYRSGSVNGSTYTAHGPSPPQPPTLQQQQNYGASASAHLSEREQMMQRLMQINMTAEATYLMAKYNNAGVSNGTR